MRDNPIGFVDPNGSQQKPSWWDKIGTSSNGLKLPPLTLAKQNEANPASISAHGFAKPAASPISSLLTIGGNAAKGASSVLTNAGLVGVAGGLFTEGATVPEGGALILGGAYARTGGLALQFANYEFYGVGNGPKVTRQFGLAVAELVLSGGTDAISKALQTSEIRKASFGLIDEGIRSIFDSVPNTLEASGAISGLSSGLQSVPSDATSSTY